MKSVPCERNVAESVGVLTKLARADVVCTICGLRDWRARFGWPLSARSSTHLHTWGYVRALSPRSTEGLQRYERKSTAQQNVSCS